MNKCSIVDSEIQVCLRHSKISLDKHFMLHAYGTWWGGLHDEAANKQIKFAMGFLRLHFVYESPESLYTVLVVNLQYSILSFLIGD